MRTLKMACLALISIPILALAKSPFKLISPPGDDIVRPVNRYERLLSDRTHDITVPLNKRTVRCLQGGYGLPSLEISVSALKSLTVFDHTTRGETEPCINAGACDYDHVEGLNPDMIINWRQPNEKISVQVVLKDVLIINRPEKTCIKVLTETVQSQVRGLMFTHLDGDDAESSMDYQTCLSIVGFVE